MKKIFWILLFSVSMLFVGCDSDCKLEYTNADGEKEEMVISKTENPEEIVKVLGALAENAPEKNDFNAVKMNVKLNADFAAKDDKGDSAAMKLDASASFEIDINTKAFYADASMKASMSSSDSKNNVNLNASGKIYKDESDVYLDASYKEGSSDTVIMKYKMTMEQLGWYIDQIGGNGDFMPDMGDIDIPDLSTEANIIEAIKQYNVVISDTTSNTVTFKIDIPVEEISADTKLAVYVTWDVKIGSLKSVKINDSTLLKAVFTAGIGSTSPTDIKVTKSKLSFELNFDYGDFKIHTLKESEKQNFSTVPSFA